MSTETLEAVVEQRKVTRIQEMVEIIDRDDETNAKDIAAEMGIPAAMVHRLVSISNIKHVTEDPIKYPHICFTGVGYSLRLTKENSITETGRRMKMSYGILARGTPAFKQCKMFSPKYFNSLIVEFNPSTTKLLKMIKNGNNGKKITKM